MCPRAIVRSQHRPSQGQKQVCGRAARVTVYHANVRDLRYMPPRLIGTKSAIVHCGHAGALKRRHLMFFLRSAPAYFGVVTGITATLLIASTAFLTALGLATPERPPISLQAVATALNPGEPGATTKVTSKIAKS